MGIKLKISDNGQEASFRCPGCGHIHTLNIKDKLPVWSWNGDLERPTFHPSVSVSGMQPSDDTEKFDDPKFDIPYICHSFVKGGKIEFLSDCTHADAGQTKELPNW